MKIVDFMKEFEGNCHINRGNIQRQVFDVNVCSKMPDDTVARRRLFHIREECHLCC